MTLIKKNIPYNLIKETSHNENKGLLDSQEIAIHTGKGKKIKIYLPPQTSTGNHDQGCMEACKEISEDYNGIIIGDLNGRHHTWDSHAREDTGGKLLADAIAESECRSLTDGTATRLVGVMVSKVPPI